MRVGKNTSDEATSRPPQLPRRLRPSAVASTCTRHSIADRGLRIADWIADWIADCDWRSAILARDVPAARADAVIAVPHFDADGVPAAVFLAAGWIAQIVLLAQLVGDVRGRRIEVARVPH